MRYTKALVSDSQMSPSFVLTNPYRYRPHQVEVGEGSARYDNSGTQVPRT